MKAKHTAVLALAAAIAFASVAMADDINFSFNGGGITVSGTFTVGPSSVPGAEEITHISGTFSDSNVGVSGTITGLYQPVSYVNTIPGVALTTGGLSYDDLFYPGGSSPADCAGYPFAGGKLDIFGVAFDISGPGGYVGDIWSNGYLPDRNGTMPNTPGYVPNLVYAAGLANATALVDNPNAGADAPAPPGRYGTLTTPESGSLILVGIGLLGLLGLTAVRARKSQPSHEASNV